MFRLFIKYNSNLPTSYHYFRNKNEDIRIAVLKITDLSNMLGNLKNYWIQYIFIVVIIQSLLLIKCIAWMY